MTVIHDLLNQSRVRALASSLPWTDGEGRSWPRSSRLLLAVPFGLLYLLLTWALFWWMAERVDGVFVIDQDRIRYLLFHIPDLTENPVGAARALIPSVVLYHDNVQLYYVSALMLVFGSVFELKEGPVRTAVLFLGTSLIGAVSGGVLLHLIYPAIMDNPQLAWAWARAWSGGSIGCFGLMGALAARARSPLPLLGFCVLLELFVSEWDVSSYTPVLHFAGLFSGFLLARYAIAPPQQQAPMGPLAQHPR